MPGYRWETFESLGANRSLPGSWLVKQFGRVSITAAQVGRHVMAPPALMSAIWDKAPKPLPPVAHAPPLPGRALPVFQPAALQLSLLAFRYKTVGFSALVRRNGTDVLSTWWGWSGPNTRWTPDTPQDVASISKLWTAAAMVQLLRSRFISIDRPILPFLPSYWDTGHNIERITFRMLLQHKSGFNDPDPAHNSRPDYPYMKQQVAAGVDQSAIGVFAYRNINYSLCRVLMAVLEQNLDPKWVSETGNPDETDKVWDLVAIRTLDGYVKDSIFAPAGVIGPELTRRAGSAYGYTLPPTAPWDSGDLSIFAGPGGWHMTVREVLDVVSYLRRGPFLPPGIFDEEVLGLGLGIDFSPATPLGISWTKGGLLQNSLDGQMTASSLRTEQSAVFIFPGNVELAIAMNSPLGPSNDALQIQLLAAYNNSLT